MKGGSFMRKGKFLLPGLFVVISLIFVVLWALAEGTSISALTEILGIWATNNNTTAIVASHSWDVTCDQTVTVYYQYTHKVAGVGEQSTPLMNETVDSPGDVHTETWTTYWNLPSGDYTASCDTFAFTMPDYSSATSTDFADFTVP